MNDMVADGVSDGASARVGLLARVDALEIAAEQRDKPWYKQASNVLSVVAVIVSSVTVLWQTQVENQNEKLNGLQEIAVDIVENSKAMNDLALSQVTPSTGNTESLLTTKANILLSRGIELMRESRGHVPPEIPFILGSQAMSLGRYADASNLLSQAASVKYDSSVHADAQRTLATLFMLPNTPLEDEKKGEKLFSSAVQQLQSAHDPWSISERGWVEEAWAQAEFANGNASAGTEHFEEAVKAYDSLPVVPFAALRSAGLQRVQQEEAMLFSLSAAGQEIMTQLSGAWKIITDGSHGDPGVGTIMFTLDANTGTLGVMFIRSPPNSGLTQIRGLGTLLIQDAHDAILNWQGTIQGFGPAVAVGGSTKFSFDSTLTSAVIVEQPVNGQPVIYKIVRLAPPSSSRLSP